MDLIGHDTNFAVTQVGLRGQLLRQALRALAGAARDGRRRPARPQERAAASTATPTGAPALPVAVHEAPATAREVTRARQRRRSPTALEQAATAGAGAAGLGPGARSAAAAGPAWPIDGARLVLTDGRTACELAARSWAWPTSPSSTARSCCPPRPAPRWPTPCTRGAGAAWRAQAPAWLAALGFAPLPVADAPGPGGGAHGGDADQRSRRRRAAGRVHARGRRRGDEARRQLPRRPLRVAGRAGACRRGRALLDALDAHYRGERYRVSPWLRPRAPATMRPAAEPGHDPRLHLRRHPHPFGRYGGALSSRAHRRPGARSRSRR